ncbi:putative hemolysin [Peptoniphilus olsenii]|uniref:Hemolysin n=1 Tax=Peptoniphilus olsenii TaxID=411570 RepID=A0ABV2J8R9_9FIRM
MDDGGALWLKLLLIVILTSINAFFASAEMAMVSANNNKIKELAEEGDQRALTLLGISQDQTRFLSTIQVAITLAGFFSSGSAATSISKVFGAFLMNNGIIYGHTISFILVTLLLSYLTLVFGELVPKRIALQNSENVALNSARTISIASKIFYPFVKLLSFSTAVVLKIMGKYSEDVEEKISEEELKSYIKVSTQQGVINSAGEEMIVNIMDFDDKLAYEIMTPRTSIYMVDYDAFSTETVDEILREGYSRMPVYRQNTDNILGTVYIKDIFVEYAKNNYEKINLDNCIKSPYFVPETKKIDQLLKELQSTKNYVAILIDEYGGFSGMVTVEDIVEEIVGEIEDEYDQEIPQIERISENEFIVDGSMDIEDINDKIGTYLYSDNHETISGLIIEKLGFIPEETEKEKLQVKVNGCILTELVVADKRIIKAGIKVLPDEQEEARREYKEWDTEQ